MKLVTIFLLVLGANLGFSQTFTLGDTSFSVGDVYTPDSGIYFDYDKAVIRQKSYYQLKLVADFLHKHPDIIIEVGGHSDSRGSDMYSTCLTCKRARSIKQYLLDNGVPEDRLIDKGYGEDRLLISDAEIAKLKTDREKEEAHAKNRRIEFKIIGILE